MDASWNVILGCPRSGTTFLVDVLKAMPYTEVLSGWVQAPEMAQITAQGLSDAIYDGLARSFRHSLENHLDNMANYRSRAVEEFFRKNITYRELLSVLRRERTLDRMVFKEPFLAFDPGFTDRAFPDGKVIHIYRDGRDAADSLIRTFDVLTNEKLKGLNTTESPMGRLCEGYYVPWWVEQGKEDLFLATTPYVRAVWMWKEMVSRCKSYYDQGEACESARVLLLGYEDLMSSPDSYGPKVVDHFGGCMSSELEKRFSGAHTKSIGIYKKRSRREIVAAENIAGAELNAYGYS